MKLVRARVKAVDQMPEWAKCCDWCIAEDQKQGEMLVDLDTIEKLTLFCPNCGVIVKGKQDLVQDSLDGLHFPLAKLDLDEGPVETA